MKLPECSTCQYKFKWRELLFFYRKKCSQCGSTQYLTNDSLWNFWLVVSLTFIPLVFLRTFHLTWGIIIAILIYIVISAIAPFYMEFTDEEQPLF